MPSTNNIKLTIGGPEVTPGTAVSRTAAIPIMGIPSLDKKFEKEIDPVIIGSNMDSGEYLIADSVDGDIPISLRATAGAGMVVKSLMGIEETPVEVGACIRLMYTGSEDSNKIVPSANGDTLTSSIGDKGSESVDASFGTAGVIDLTDPATDTVSELVAVIEAYSDYSCEKLFGENFVDTADILEFTTPANSRQGASRWVYIYFGSITSGVYKHEFTPDLGDDEKPTYSVQYDGRQDNMLYDGVVVDTMSFTAALKSMVESTMTILGLSESIGESASSVELEDIDPLIFHKGSFYLGENLYTFIRNHNLEITNNNNAEGYGQGSPSRLFQQKGKFEVSGDMQVRLDATSYAERAKVETGTLTGISFVYTGKEIVTDIKEMILVELPYCALSNFEFPENSGVFDAKINFKAFNPKGTEYSDPITITFFTTDSGAY